MQSSQNNRDSTMSGSLTTTTTVMYILLLPFLPSILTASRSAPVLQTPIPGTLQLQLPALPQLQKFQAAEQFSVSAPVTRQPSMLWALHGTSHLQPPRK